MTAGNQRYALIAIVTICLVAVGVLVYRDYAGRTAAPEATAPAEGPPEQAEVKTSVRVTLTACNRTPSGRMRMDGYILNTGTGPLHFVTVRSIWKNRAGLEIGTETFYALNGAALDPGDRKTFSHTTDLASAARCNAEPVDWW